MGCRPARRRWGSRGRARWPSAPHGRHRDRRSANLRRRSARRHCAAGCWSPCRRRFRSRHWRADWGRGREKPPAPHPRHYRWVETRPCLRPGPPSGRRRPGSGALRYSASPQHYRRRYCRNCPARRPAACAAKNPAPAAPSHHRPTRRRAGDICRSRRRRRGRISCRRWCCAPDWPTARPRSPRPAPCATAASPTAAGDAPASAHRADPAATAP